MEIKIYLKSLLFFLIPLVILLLILNTLYYFDIVNNSLIKYLKILILLIPCFISGLVRGFNSMNKGYINGLKLSFLIVLIFFVISLLLSEFHFKDLIYYIIISLTITFGAMIGINKKTN